MTIIDDFGPKIMSKNTKIVLLIWMSQANRRDFLFGDNPLNRWANLLLFTWDSESLFASREKMKKIVITIRAIHAINIKNAIIIDIFLFVSLKLNWYISDTQAIRINWFDCKIILIYRANVKSSISFWRNQWMHDNT